MANSSKACRVVTGKRTIFAYLMVNTPSKRYTDGAPIYSVQLIIPKSDTATMSKIKDAIAAAYAEGIPKLMKGYDAPPAFEELKLPVHDGDIEKPDKPEYKDAWFINANNTRHKPQVVDADRNPITDTNELYSGIIGRASIQFYAFNSRGERGIACALGNLQKLADGPNLGHEPTAEEDFGGDEE